MMSTPATSQDGAVAAEEADGASRLELVVSGMSCASCAVRVQKTLGRQPGVQRAEVNYATSYATVTFDPDQTGLDPLSAAVERIGYEIAPLMPVSPVEDVDEGGIERSWLRR